MVQHCCVPFCKTRVGDTDIYGCKFKFHRMPHTVERFAEWAKQITDNQRLKPVLSSGSRVCSRHFHKEDYLVKNPIGNNSLKKEICPTIFQWNSTNFNSESSSSDEQGQIFSPVESLKRRQKLMESTDSSEYDLINHPPEIQENDGNGNICKEVIRKNTVIRQLLTRILELEDEEKGMRRRIAELRAVNENYQQQIRELTAKNNKLELSLNVSKSIKKKEVHGKHIEPNSDESPEEKKIKLDN